MKKFKVYLDGLYDDEGNQPGRSPSASSAEAPSKSAGPVSSLSCDAIVSCGPAKRKSGEPVKCPVCHYYTRIYGACYVCGSITGRRKKESATERQPTANIRSLP